MTAEAPLLTYVEFRSDLFPPYEGEEEAINSGLYGKRLAEFLIAGLRAEGFECLEPVAEDWGWRVEIKNANFPLWIGCGRYQEYPDGFLCFIEPHQPVIRKLFKKIETRGRIELLQQAMEKLLAVEPGIRARRWRTHAEFNNTERR